MSLSRRTLLGAGVGLAAGAFALPSFKPQQIRRRPKNIIFMVADGMAISAMTMADQFQQMVHGKRSYWHELTGQDYAVNGFQATSSLNSLVTDSSAASSAWGSGRLIWNGQVNMFPDGTKLRPLARIMQDAGVRIGLVTTTTITHATPAGFAVNMVQRDMEAEIAVEYLASGVDVLFGGGNRHFSASGRKDKRNLFADFIRAGYSVAQNKQELQALKGRKMLGIFSEGHMPFTVDHVNTPTLRDSTPTLQEMMKVALANLKDSPKGFLLQVEGGRVDHGGHSNDLAATIYDQIAFEEAVKTAVEFALADGETLVVVTTDHACGGLALNGAGEEYIEATAGLKMLAGMKASYEKILADVNAKPTLEGLRDSVKARLDIELTPAEAEAVAAARAGKSPFSASEFHRSTGATLAMVLGNHTKVTWTSGNHTSDHVMVTAVGPGKEAFHGLRHSYEYFDILLAMKGLKHSNPRMTFEQAAPHYEKLKQKLPPETQAAHWNGECDC